MVSKPPLPLPRLWDIFIRAVLVFWSLDCWYACSYHPASSYSTHSLTQQIITDCLVCAGLSARGWVCRSGQEGPGPHPQKINSLVERKTIINQQTNHYKAWQLCAGKAANRVVESKSRLGVIFEWGLTFELDIVWEARRNTLGRGGGLGKGHETGMNLTF
jgi:hypothetical protein